MSTLNNVRTHDVYMRNTQRSKKMETCPFWEVIMPESMGLSREKILQVNHLGSFVA